MKNQILNDYKKATLELMFAKSFIISERWESKTEKENDAKISNNLMQIAQSLCYSGKQVQ
jgi:hypothetical protein